MRALVVDTDGRAASGLQTGLSVHGASASTAEPADAASRLRGALRSGQPYAVVFLGPDTSELADALWAVDPDVQIVAQGAVPSPGTPNALLAWPGRVDGAQAAMLLEVLGRKSDLHRQARAQAAAAGVRQPPTGPSSSPDEVLEVLSDLVDGLGHEIGTPLQIAMSSAECLAATISELRTILEAHRAAVGSLVDPALDAELVGRLELLSAGLPGLDLDAREALDALGEGLQRAARVVRWTGSFARPTQMVLRIENPNALVERVTRVMIPRWRGVASFALVLEAERPLRCHAPSIALALLHLVRNAAEAIDAIRHPNDVPGRIELRTRDVEDAVEIEVIDNGPGIPEAMQARIFHPFVSGRTPLAHGRGLAVARALVVGGHGGELDVESAIGIGTTMRVRLPLRGPDPARRRHAHAA
jgi:signal transduction histidine kinase